MKLKFILLALSLVPLASSCTPPETRSIQELEALKQASRRSASTPERINWENRYHACFYDSAPMPNYGDKSLQSLVTECEAAKKQKRRMDQKVFKPVQNYVINCYGGWKPKFNDDLGWTQFAANCAEKGHPYDRSKEGL